MALKYHIGGRFYTVTSLFCKGCCELDQTTEYGGFVVKLQISARREWWKRRRNYVIGA
ncbi:hypothetical protein WN48_09581 [Eufriesea mexicana]|uniref:Uncharacterized protein n=1 Tax=Eufriesea mexicana TaxID=516756 RepID=A0A310SEB4_9HYME|nr:hypothetical protein WN48_09581 [Eufriesea mexicana]